MIKLSVIVATRDIIALMHTLMGAQPVAMGLLIDYVSLLPGRGTLAVIGFLLAWPTSPSSATSCPPTSR